MDHYKLIIVLLILLCSCNKEYNTIGLNLIDNDPFETDLEEVPIFVKMKKVPPYVVNLLQTFQLGQYQDNIFGKTDAVYFSQISLETVSPRFGIFNENDEVNGIDGNIACIPEEEKIKDVFLDIPFFTNVEDDDNDGVINRYDVDSTNPQSDSDVDGVSDIVETQTGQNPLSSDTDGDGIPDGDDDDSVNPDTGSTLYDLDSIIGNEKAKFKIKVSELDYYLRSYDPTSNFEKFQQYFSNNQIPSNFSGKVLFDDEVQINPNELVFWNEDNPDTADEDESTTLKERLSPRIRIPLDKDFFQKKIIDNEGSEILSNNESFKLFVKGLVIEAYDFDEPIHMILNFREAEVRLVYDFKKYNKNGTDDDTTDDEIEDEEKFFNLKLDGYRINSIKNEPYPSNITTQISDTINNPQSVFLKGGEGIMAEIELFKNNDGVNLLEEIKQKEWLVNEANLTMYIDQNMISSKGGIVEPNRLYVYDLKTKQPLIDYFIDDTNGPKDSQKKIIHGGIIELDENKKGLLYKIKITEHVKNVIRKDSTNVKLGLVVTSDISSSLNTEVQDSEQIEFIPTSSVINPFGTVLIGPNPNPSDYNKRMKLNLYYTKAK
ncbi:MAG: hypothetical protein CMC50_05330 [Flavobacteriaceae bacterium]|nr:hypothetical protein [Flavobacteriaceae bacterium]